MLQNICFMSKSIFKPFSSYFEYSTRARNPSIKFIGTRHPQPKFSASQKINERKTSASDQKMVLEFNELPAKFRRKLISEEEIQIINNGGFRN